MSKPPRAKRNARVMFRSQVPRPNPQRDLAYAAPAEFSSYKARQPRFVILPRLDRKAEYQPPRIRRSSGVMSRAEQLGPTQEATRPAIVAARRLHVEEAPRVVSAGAAAVGLNAWEMSRLLRAERPETWERVVLAAAAALTFALVVIALL